MTSTRIPLAGLLVLSVLLLGGVAWAGSSDNYAVDWWVMSGGGAPAVSGFGEVALDGSLGQTAIGPSAGGDATLGAGYWLEEEPAPYIYLPVVLRGS